MFPGEIRGLLVSEIARGIRDGKQSFVFPTGLFIRKNKLTNKGLLAITAVIEYIAYDILSIACINVIRNKKIRLSSNDIYDAIWSDMELTYICQQNGIYLIRKQAPVIPKSHLEQFIQRCSPALRCNKDVLATLSSYIEEYIGTLLYQQQLLPSVKN